MVKAMLARTWPGGSGFDEVATVWLESAYARSTIVVQGLQCHLSGRPSNEFAGERTGIRASEWVCCNFHRQSQWQPFVVTGAWPVLGRGYLGKSGLHPREGAVTLGSPHGGWLDTAVLDLACAWRF